MISRFGVHSHGHWTEIEDPLQISYSRRDLSHGLCRVNPTKYPHSGKFREAHPPHNSNSSPGFFKAWCSSTPSQPSIRSNKPLRISQYRIQSLFICPRPQNASLIGALVLDFRLVGVASSRSGCEDECSSVGILLELSWAEVVQSRVHP